MADKLFKDYYNEKTEASAIPSGGKLLLQTGTDEPEKIDVGLITAKSDDSDRLGGQLPSAYATKTELDSINFDGVKVYETLADAQAVTPTPSDFTGFSVDPLTDPSNAGQYYYLASETNGTKFYKGYQKDLSYTSINLFNPNTVVSGVYINLGNGNLDNGGANFAVSGWIEIDPNLDYYIQGRNNTAGDVALRFKNNLGTILKPYTSQGVEASNFTMPTPNGRFYAPPTAVAVQFTVRFSTATLPEILIFKGTESVDWYLPFKEVVSNEEIPLRPTIDVSQNHTVGSEALDEYLLNNDQILQKVELPYDLIDGEFVNAGSGAIAINTNATRTTWIPIANDKIYYIKGRVTNAGVVFRNSAGTLIKPIDSNGVTQNFFWLNYLNGRLYIPPTAVDVMITTKYLETSPETFSFYYSQIRTELVNSLQDISLFLPDEIETYIGDTLQVFKYAMIDAYDPSQYRIEIISDKNIGINYVGDDYPRYWQFVPTVVESFGITALLYSNSGKLLDSAKTTIKVGASPTVPTSAINVLMIGDSLTFYNRIPDEFKRVLTSNDSLSNTADTLSENQVIKFAGKNFNNINLIGTQRNNYLGWTGGQFHEGYSGRACNWFLSSASPFVSSGTFNMQNYLTSNSLAAPDVIYIGLGWNDIFQRMTFNGDTSLVENDFKTLLREIHSDLPNASIYLWSENFPSLLGGDGAHPYGSDHRTNVRNWKVRLQSLFKIFNKISLETEFSNYVKFIPSHLMFDSENMMQFENVRKNTRIMNTEVRGTDDVHPNDGGFFQIADSLVRSFIYNHLN